VNPRGVRTGVRGVRRRALGALAHRKRGDALIRVTPPHLQQAPGGRDEAKRGVVHLRRAVQRVARHDLRARPAPLLLGGVSAMVAALLLLGGAELALTGRAESYTSVVALLLYVGAYQARRAWG